MCGKALHANDRNGKGSYTVRKTITAVDGLMIDRRFVITELAPIHITLNCVLPTDNMERRVPKLNTVSCRERNTGFWGQPFFSLEPITSVKYVKSKII